jgi:acyl carrier protein
VDEGRDNSSAPWDPAFEKLIRAYLPELPAAQSLAPGMNLRTNGLSSLSAVTLISRIESAYALRFPDELLTFEMFQTPATLWSAIQEVRHVPDARDQETKSS